MSQDHAKRLWSQLTENLFFSSLLGHSVYLASTDPETPQHTKSYSDLTGVPLDGYFPVALTKTYA